MSQTKSANAFLGLHIEFEKNRLNAIISGRIIFFFMYKRPFNNPYWLFLLAEFVL